MSERIVLFPGDGIGPEIVDAAAELLNAVAEGKLEFDKRLIGGASIDAYGVPLTDETLETCRSAGAVLLGAVGGPEWDKPDNPNAPRPEQGLLGLRKGLGLYANLRPVRPYPALYGASPLREERVKGTDLLIVRELTGGIYFGKKGRDKDGRVWDECIYSRAEIRRIAHVAFGAATGKVTSVDYGDRLKTSRLWREVVTEVAKEYEVPVEHMEITKTRQSELSAIRELISKPAQFDVILIENMLGDIVSDVAAMLSGSLGMLPSASLGADGTPGLFEPAHGSAPDIAGKHVANPLATFLSGALMLDQLDLADEAEAIRTAVDKALAAGLRTRDLGGTASTSEATSAVLKYL